jgi:mRNA interferase RelE/StbE
MKTVFLQQFNKDLDKLLDKRVQNDIVEAIVNVENANKVIEILNLKKLKGYKNAYRIKIGHYRIGIFIEKSKVEFARVVHRKDIYTVFP